MTVSTKVDTDLWYLDVAAVIGPVEGCGVVWQQQTGGVCCHHRDVEGVPLMLPKMDELARELEQLHEHPCLLGMSAQDADRFDALFERLGVPLRVDRDALDDSEEAWVYVRLHFPSGLYLRDHLQPWRDERLVLTWENCD